MNRQENLEAFFRNGKTVILPLDHAVAIPVPGLENPFEMVERVSPFVDGYVIFRTKLPLSLIDGPGRVEASFDHLHISGSDPAKDAVLRFHFMETLVCNPDCSIEREEVPGDRVGFMRIPAPHPAEFSIDNQP